jgi:class 3 adenylate cyclase
VELEQRFRASPDEAGRPVLVTLLFTDLVGSTRLAARLGDHRWAQLLAAHGVAVRTLLARYGGQEVDDAGDGFFATFDLATSAVRCASQMVSALAELGLGVRVGLHTGECVRLNGKVRGLAVHAAARVLRKAGSGEVLVTRTVRDVVSGSDLRFEDRGLHELDDLVGPWRLFAAVNGHREAADPRAGGSSVHRPRRKRHPASAGHSM